jgi:hypothetical protein
MLLRHPILIYVELPVVAPLPHSTIITMELSIADHVPRQPLSACCSSFFVPLPSPNMCSTNILGSFLSLLLIETSQVAHYLTKANMTFLTRIVASSHEGSLSSMLSLVLNFFGDEMESSSSDLFGEEGLDSSLLDLVRGDAYSRKMDLCSSHMI